MDEISLLQTLVKNTQPKESFFISVKDKSTHIRTSFNPLIQFDKTKKYEMALVSLETYYSFPNLDMSNNNFRYSPDNGSTWFNIDIPEGCYEISGINAYVQRIMKANGHYDFDKDKGFITIKANNNTLKSILDIEKNYKVDLATVNSVRSILGFNRQIYMEGYNESENIVNILRVSSLNVTSDIIGASFTNGVTKNIIYSFFPNVGPGYKIVQEPLNLIYLPVTLNTISRMETKLEDQDGNLINLRGEELSIRFHIREA